MPTYNAQYTPSSAAAKSQNSSVTFGADISQAPVYLSVDIIPSHSFARLMLALGRVVRMQDVVVERDHSAYQNWVKGEYIKELEGSSKASEMKKLPGLLEKRKLLKNPSL